MAPIGSNRTEERDGAANVGGHRSIVGYRRRARIVEWFNQERNVQTWVERGTTRPFEIVTRGDGTGFGIESQPVRSAALR
ncbi:unannotated protein [freshwater metagenome]|uniref:Unannotated protein n=1 Tax=freshwater metagenome TaxID=449393 RepID=A0A6J6GSJ9_9ZZZZ